MKFLGAEALPSTKDYVRRFFHNVWRFNRQDETQWVAPKVFEEVVSVCYAK